MVAIIVSHRTSAGTYQAPPRHRYEKRFISEIRVGTRLRKDLGDLSTLSESMNVLGLLQPIIVDEELNLLAGARRLAAARKLGWTEIDCKIVYYGEGEDS